MKKSNVDTLIIPEGIQAYFSHSYRASDREINLFFWELFSEEKFFFTVDPKSDKLVVPHLERMMMYSDCFIAVVTRRLEQIERIGDVSLPNPQSHWTHSPYIAFENCLAELAGKPRLIFIERGLNSTLFGTSDCVHIFERMTLNKKRSEYREIVHTFAEKVRAYASYEGRIRKPTAKAGIVIDESEMGYSAQVISNIQEVLNSGGGYASELISPNFTSTQGFARKLSDLELIVMDVRHPYITLDALGFIQAKGLPCIRIAKLSPGESRTVIKLPALLKDYQIKKEEIPIIAWTNKEELIFEIYLCLSKFLQSRTLFDTFEEGKRYFVSAGRKPAKIFISNPHSLNSLALNLVKGFQTVNIQFFHYQASQTIGQAWQRGLQKELEQCDIFVALINDDYHTSDWCKYELKTAFERWKREEVEILPYIVEPTKLPELIKDDVQCAFVDKNSQESLVETIVNKIDEYLTSKETGFKGDQDTEETLRKEVYGKGKGWAVLVGANEYEDSLHYPLLQVCVKDATSLKEQLITSGYDKDRIKILTDKNDELPTRDNILVALKSIAEATEPDDLLLFYYSGHGVEKNGESFLVARNGRHLVIEDTAVSVTKIKEIMRAAPARAKVIILDACHSGVNFGKGAEPMTPEFIRRVFEEAKGFAILASCEQGQVSYEWRQNERSAFTHYLLEALRGKADFENKGRVTIQDINRYVTDQVKLWASQRNLSQTPTLHYEVSGDIILVRH